MKIIFLNCWQGELLQPLKHFIESHKADTDVFCLQEINGAEAVLDDILGAYTKCHTEKNDLHNPEFDQKFDAHMATYARPGIEVVSSGPLMQEAVHEGFGLYTQMAVGTKPLHIVNMHGYPWPGKSDTPGRIKQSKIFLDCLKDKEGVRIAGGDLNVSPDTKSVLMFEERGYQDLIRTYSVPTTRNHFAWDRWPTKELYSDYVFVDEGTSVTNFSVPDMEISDHLPMILEIQL